MKKTRRGRRTARRKKGNGPGVLTLLTDFGLGDPYVGSMKGVILGINPQVTLVDISHQVGPQGIREAAFLLDSSYKYFPAGTIHVIVVDPGVGSKRKILCARSQGYFFLAPDNGVLGPLLANDKKAEVFAVEEGRYFLREVSRTFHGRDIFAPVAAHLSLGLDPGKLGRRCKRYRSLALKEAVCQGRTGIRGEVIHIDHFGNLITNITECLWARKVKRAEEVSIKVGRRRIAGTASSYASWPEGKLLAIWGSSGRLEISSGGGSAQKKLKVRVGSPVSITWG